jgi:hypothetical protein
MQTSPDRTRRSGGHARSGPLLRVRDAEAAPPRHRAPAARSREGTRARSGGRRSVALAACAGAVVLLGGGAALLLGGDDPRPTPPAAAGRPSAAPSVPSSAPTPPAQAGPSAAVAAATAATADAAGAAVRELMAALADGNLALLRSTWAGEGAAASQAAQAVATSSSDLSAVLSAWYDPATATQIRSGLDQQSEASRAYAGAVAAADVPAADRARARMGEVSRRLGEVLDEVTDGRIAGYVPPQDAAQYRAYVDALEGGDTVDRDEAARWLRGRLVREGAALAAGLAGAGPS